MVDGHAVLGSNEKLLGQQVDVAPPCSVTSLPPPPPSPSNHPHSLKHYPSSTGQQFAYDSLADGCRKRTWCTCCSKRGRSTSSQAGRLQVLIATWLHA